MPIYTYRCSNCGVQFDQQQKFSDATLTRCPECDKKTLHKVFQPVGIVFKGSGFYATDHRSPSGQGRHPGKDKDAPADKPAAPASSGDSGSSSTSDSGGGSEKSGSSSSTDS